MNKGILAMQAYWQAKGKASMGDGGAAPTPVKAKASKAAPMPKRHFRVTLAVVNEGVKALWGVDAYAPTMKRAVREARAMRRATKRPGTVEAVVSVVDKDLCSLAPEKA